MPHLSIGGFFRFYRRVKFSQFAPSAFRGVNTLNAFGYYGRVVPVGGQSPPLGQFVNHPLCIV
jgi:hypothetical protein